MTKMDIKQEAHGSDYAIEYWLSHANAKTIEYADYWNDERAEQDKEWNVLAHGFAPLEAHLTDSGFADDIRACLAALPNPLAGNGIDLAAGCLWATPLLLSCPDVRHLYCLEYSAHRLLNLGPPVLRHYGVDPANVTLVYGSFYDLLLPNRSLDFALLASAFHHAKEPARLLAEVRRVLKPGGVAIITGEPRITWLGEHFKYFVKLLFGRLLPASLQERLFGRVLNSVSWPPCRANVFPVDPVLGDHLYTCDEYCALFEAAGFAWKEVPSKRMRAFVLFAR